MAKCKLFANWTWSREMPAPFNHPDIATSSTDSVSQYNRMASKRATLHSATLSGILAYLELEAAVGAGAAGVGAIGFQGNNKIIAEYPSRSGKKHAVTFNQDTGKFNAGKFSNPSDTPEPYLLKSDKDSGAALFFTLVPCLLEDDEFRAAYEELILQKLDGYDDVEATARCGYILCDNVYRRIENADSLGSAGIKTVIPTTCNIQGFTSLNLSKGAYAPTSTLLGTFEILTAREKEASAAISHQEFQGKYALEGSALSALEQAMVPELPSWYVIPQEVAHLCEHIQKTTGTEQPMRNFLLRGPSGTGKTEAVKAVAAGLHIPYTHITCSANTEIFDFFGQILPDVEGLVDNSEADGSLPSFQDIQLDPASAYFKLTGEYRPAVTDAEVYEKMVEVIRFQEKQTAQGDDQSTQRKYR